MTTDDGTPPGLVNPYLSAARRPAVWGVTLGRVGLAAAGVLAVAIPSGELGSDGAQDATGKPGAIALTGSDDVVVGTADDVQSEIDAACRPAGYLWPAAPCDGPAVSPALAR